MPNAAKVNFNVIDLTEGVATGVNGVSFVMGSSIRGPINNPDEVITSWKRFVTKHGGFGLNDPTAHLVKILLDGGGKVRFNRLGHYTDITDPETLDATKATQASINLLTFDGPFVDSNEIIITINGDDTAPVLFDTDSDTTMDDLATEIANSPHVKSASVVESGDPGPDGNRTIIIVPEDGVTLDITAVTITGGVSQPVDTITVSSGVVSTEGNTLFSLVPKYAGEDYNNFTITISAASNGQPGYFNLTISHNIESITENYQNLIIESNNTAANSTFLDAVVQGSDFFDVVYEDLSQLVGQLQPLPGAYPLMGGTDGGALEVADFIGDSASKTGFYAFDDYEDAYQIGVFNSDEDQVHTAGSAYCANRKDLIYFLALDTDLVTKQSMKTKRDSLSINTQFTYIVGPGLKVTDPITSQVKVVSPIAQAMALASNSELNFGPWYSFSGMNRGLTYNVLGLTNNFGSPASYADLDDLAQSQINMFVSKNGVLMLSGNFSAQYKNTQQKFINIVRLVMFIKKSLRPTLEGFLEEPNDIPTWKRMYYTVKPFLDSLVTNRALYDYNWQGDQDASSLDDLVINDPTDVGNGKYQVRLAIKAIPSIQEITIDIILTPTGIDFELVSELI